MGQQSFFYIKLKIFLKCIYIVNIWMYNQSVLYMIIQLIHVEGMEVLFLINVDARSSRPIYEQIINGMKENILKGILKPGDRLPSVREMSAMITANPNTVSKAYAELERQKVIETIRGKGTYVSMNYKPRVDEDRIERLKESIKNIIVEGHYMGLKREDIIKMLDEVYRDIERE